MTWVWSSSGLSGHTGKTISYLFANFPNNPLRSWLYLLFPVPYLWVADTWYAVTRPPRWVSAARDASSDQSQGAESGLIQASQQVPRRPPRVDMCQPVRYVSIWSVTWELPQPCSAVVRSDSWLATGTVQLVFFIYVEKITILKNSRCSDQEPAFGDICWYEPEASTRVFDGMMEWWNVATEWWFLSGGLQRMYVANFK